MVMNFFKSLNSWLQGLTVDEISYQALREILDNSAQVSQDTRTVGRFDVFITELWASLSALVSRVVLKLSL